MRSAAVVFARPKLSSGARRTTHMSNRRSRPGRSGPEMVWIQGSSNIQPTQQNYGPAKVEKRGTLIAPAADRDGSDGEATTLCLRYPVRDDEPAAVDPNPDEP